MNLPESTALTTGRSLHPQGKWSAPHFTAKARIMDYVKEQHPDIIGVFPSVCAFYTNWIERIPPKCAACTGLPCDSIAVLHHIAVWVCFAYYALYLQWCRHPYGATIAGTHCVLSRGGTLHGCRVTRGTLPCHFAPGRMRPASWSSRCRSAGTRSCRGSTP